MPIVIDWETICAVWAFFMGVVAGMASMLLYLRVSPQEKLKALKLECAAIQQELATWEGDFGGAMGLAGQNMRLAFRRLGCVLGPSLVAGLPVILAYFAVGDYIYPYFLATVVTAIAVKYQFQIS